MNNDLRESEPTIRFWVSVHNNFVRLSLRPSQTRRHSEFEYTDEGFERNSRSWTHKGDRIVESSYHKARDCDGLYEGWTVRECEADQMTARTSEYAPGYLLPEWEHISSSQRDHSAEAAGY